MGRNLTDIKKIIIHCSDSDDSLDIGIKEINSWHKQNGWLDENGVSCGYHYIVRRNGKYERGRDDNIVGAHCYGHNRESIGIVWVGRNNPSPAQMDSLIHLINTIRFTYSIDVMDVYGHYEFDTKGKTCPNLDMNKLRGELLFYRSGK